jgi:hypothetical protein
MLFFFPHPGTNSARISPGFLLAGTRNNPPTQQGAGLKPSGKGLSGIIPLKFRLLGPITD